MAYAHEIKFFVKENVLFVALFDNPLFFCDEFWIKNVEASELGINELPEGLQLDKKYKVEELGIKPFETTKPEFEFIDTVAKTAWETGIRIVPGVFSSLDDCMESFKLSGGITRLKDFKSSLV